MRMASQTFSPRSISFAIPESKLPITVENLHREFFRSPDPEIFAAAEAERRVPEAARHRRAAGPVPVPAYGLTQPQIRRKTEHF